MTPVHKNTLVRQQQIVSAATKLIVKYGSEHLTIRRIAKEVGVSEGAIYRHFKSKRDILSLLVEHLGQLIITDIEKSRTDNIDTLDKIEGRIAEHISAVEKRKGISFQIIAEIISLGDKGLNKQVYDVINRYIQQIRDILSEGAKAGVIRQDIDLDAVATAFFSITQGLINIWTLGHYNFNLSEKHASLWHIIREAIIKH